jgi:hypothetical protein
MIERISIKPLFFVEEDPGRGSENIKKNITSTVLIFSSFFLPLMDVMFGKITINLK